MSRDEGHVDDGVEGGKAAVHRQPPRRFCLPVGGANRRQQLRRAGELRLVSFVNPIPGEVGDDDRRDAAAAAAAQPSGGASETTKRAACVPRRAASCARPLGQRSIELVRALDGQLFVEAQAVDLDDAGVALAREERDRHTHGPIEQPARRRRAHHDFHIRTAGAERVDDFDLPRGMAEAVARDVEEDGRHQRKPPLRRWASRPGRRPRALRRACSRDGTPCPCARHREARSGRARSWPAG